MVSVQNRTNRSGKSDADRQPGYFSAYISAGPIKITEKGKWTCKPPLPLYHSSMHGLIYSKDLLNYFRCIVAETFYQACMPSNSWKHPNITVKIFKWALRINAKKTSSGNNCLSPLNQLIEPNQSIVDSTKPTHQCSFLRRSIGANSMHLYRSSFFSTIAEHRQSWPTK